MFGVNVSRVAGSWAGFVALALFSLLALQMLQFRFGYRLTADDAMFLQFLWQGWERVWAEAVAVAEFSGRIGHYAMTPLNALGAWLSGFTWGRFAILSLYYLVFVLFSAYVSRLLVGDLWRRVAAFMVLVLLSLHPLAYEHMPPNAYPLQNTLPFLVVLIVRLCLLRWPNAHWLFQVFAYAAMAGAMLVSEFVFLFATALMATDHLSLFVWPRAGVRRVRVLGGYCSIYKLLADGFVVVFVLGVYLGFRFQYPSMYEGNDPSGLANPLQFVVTALLHIDAGTVFHRLSRLDFGAVTTGSWLVAVAVTGLTALCAFLLLPRLPRLSIRAAILVAVVSGILMFYMVAPLAATERQQQWCLDGGVCGYLDSRVAYLGIAAVAYALFSLLFSVVSETNQRLAGAGFALLLGLVAGVNYVSNSVVGSDMRQVVSAWSRAEAIACGAEDSVWLSEQQMSTIDPAEQVTMHANTDRRVFWLEYMNFVRRMGVCEQGGRGDNARALKDGFYTGFTSWSSQAREVLGNGWSAPEHWGVWSDGRVSTLKLPLKRGVHDDVVAIRFQFSPYFGPSLGEQVVTVLLDGQTVATWRFDQGRHGANGCCEREVPFPESWSGGPLTVSLVYQAVRQPGFPGEGQDVRQLALGLRSLTFVQ